MQNHSPREITELSLKIDMIRSRRFINSIDHLFERRLKGKRLVHTNSVGERKLWAAGGPSIAKDEGDEMGGERVEVVGGLGVEESE